MQEQKLSTDQSSQPLSPSLSESNQSAIPLISQTTIEQAPKQNYWQIIAIVFLFLFFATAGALAYLLQKKNTEQSSVIRPVQTEIVASPSLSSVNSSPIESASQGETTNWKTYTNKDLGFSFNYPDDFTYRSLGPNVSQKAIDNGGQISDTSPPSYETLLFSNNKMYFAVSVFHIISKDFIKDRIVEKLNDGRCGSQFASNEIADQIIGNYRYIEQKIGPTSEDRFNITQYFCILNKKNQLIVVNTDVLDEKSSSPDTLISQILSTFKFSN